MKRENNTLNEYSTFITGKCKKYRKKSRKKSNEIKI